MTLQRPQLWYLWYNLLKSALLATTTHSFCCCITHYQVLRLIEVTLVVKNIICRPKIVEAVFDGLRGRGDADTLSAYSPKYLWWWLDCIRLTFGYRIQTVLRRIGQVVDGGNSPAHGCVPIVLSITTPKAHGFVTTPTSKAHGFVTTTTP